MGLHVRGIIAHQTRYRSISLDIARYRAPGSISLDIARYRGPAEGLRTCLEARVTLPVTRARHKLGPTASSRAGRRLGVECAQRVEASWPRDPGHVTNKDRQGGHQRPRRPPRPGAQSLSARGFRISCTSTRPVQRRRLSATAAAGPSQSINRRLSATACTGTRRLSATAAARDDKLEASRSHGGGGEASRSHGGGGGAP